VVDVREQTPLVFTRLQAVSGTLYSGDYSIQGLEAIFSVERKSIEDLVS
jgi:ERCC4-type nuclease